MQAEEVTATVADCATWLGIPLDELEDLVQHPAVARALIAVRRAYEEWHETGDFGATMRMAGLRPEMIFAKYDLPVVDPDGLDIKKVRLELALMRDDEDEAVQERRHYQNALANVSGVQERAREAERLLKDVDKRFGQAIELLVGARRGLKGEQLTSDGEVIKTFGGDPMLDIVEKRVEQAIECLKGGMADGN